jgi:hypothetical protein
MILLTPSSTKSTDYIGYLTWLYPTKVYSLTLIYRNKSANALVSLLKYLYPSTIKLLGNWKMLMLV